MSDNDKNTDIENSLFCGKRIGDMDKAGLLEVIRWMDEDARSTKKQNALKEKLFDEIEESRPSPGIFNMPLMFISIIIISLFVLMNALMNLLG